MSRRRRVAICVCGTLRVDLRGDSMLCPTDDSATLDTGIRTKYSFILHQPVSQNNREQVSLYNDTDDKNNYKLCPSKHKRAR